MQFRTLSLLVAGALSLTLGACSSAKPLSPWLTNVGSMAYPAPLPQGNLLTTRLE